MPPNSITIDQALARILNIGNLPIGMSIWTILYALREEVECELENAINAGEDSAVVQALWARLAFSDQRVTLAKTIVARVSPEYSPEPLSRDDKEPRIAFCVDKTELADLLLNEFGTYIEEWGPSEQALIALKETPEPETQEVSLKATAIKNNQPNIKRLRTNIKKLELCIGLFVDYFSVKGNVSIRAIADKIAPVPGSVDGKDVNQTRRKLLSSCLKARERHGYKKETSKSIPLETYTRLNLDAQWIEFFEEFPSELQTHKS